MSKKFSPAESQQGKFTVFNHKLEVVEVVLTLIALLVLITHFQAAEEITLSYKIVGELKSNLSQNSSK